MRGLSICLQEYIEMTFGELLIIFYIFILAVLEGVEIISKVPPTLHTPLMSGSNAISGITIVGSLIACGNNNQLTAIVGCFAVVFATINVIGGYAVTERMLKMFKKK